MIENIKTVLLPLSRHFPLIRVQMVHRRCVVMRDLFFRDLAFREFVFLRVWVYAGRSVDGNVFHCYLLRLKGNAFYLS